MKKYALLFFLTISVSVVFAQNTKNTLDRCFESNWITLNPEMKISANGFFENNVPIKARDINNSFKQLSNKIDDLKMEHVKFQQIFKGIPVEGAQYIVHAKNDIALNANGRLVNDITDDSYPTINAEKALAIALKEFDADTYLWELKDKEALIKELQQDPSATFYPTPELVYADEFYRQLGAAYKLSWKIDIHAVGEKAHQTLFVDAHTGKVNFVLEGCQTHAVPATVVTGYDGTHEMTVDSIAPDSFRLFDSTRAGGIHVLNMRRTDQVDSAVEFYDHDNHWENFNDEWDHAGSDVHWGLQETYDYFLNEHNHDSYDNEGSPILAYVHRNVNWFNARWTGMWMEFGDGTGNPLTSIDIVSHEITHGVTGRSAGLIYRGESGALNESFSDIFGAAVEFYVRGDSADWYMGTKDFQFRNLSDPGEFEHPRTYSSLNWFYGSGDNFGVHTNSGVQNYWFYILSEGGIGNNDLSNPFDVDGLGIDKAGAIAYRNLTNYLTASSNYYDARHGSLRAAADLYGECSYEVIQTAKAWYAAGVGPDTLTHDFELLEISDPQSGCDLSENQVFTVKLKYNREGCSTGLPAGTQIPISYRSGFRPKVYDTLTLENDLLGGEIIEHTTTNSVDMSEPGRYSVNFKIEYGDDLISRNDFIDGVRFYNTEVVVDSFLLDFESSSELTNFVSLLERPHSNVEMRSGVGASNTSALNMTGFNFGRNAVVYPDSTTTDVFDLNTDFIGKACICVDAMNRDSVFMSFDLRQTYAEVLYARFTDEDASQFATSMRLRINDTIYGDVFHPETAALDTFQRYNYDLSNYAGTQFTLCFEGQHLVRMEESGSSGDGDHTYIDSLAFEFVGGEVATSDVKDIDNDISIYPNPNSGTFSLKLNGKYVGQYEINITNMFGQRVHQLNGTKHSEKQNVNIKLDDNIPGVYFVNYQYGAKRILAKVLVE